VTADASPTLGGLRVRLQPQALPGTPGAAPAAPAAPAADAANAADAAG